jgi:hypothetical protein
MLLLADELVLLETLGVSTNPEAADAMLQVAMLYLSLSLSLSLSAFPSLCPSPKSISFEMNVGQNRAKIERL